MYDTIDVHGGSVGVPVWMTEPRRNSEGIRASGVLGN
jgi:hypothetical protein